MKPTVIITGGSRGIGRAAARLFAKRGYAVVIGWHAAEAEASSICSEILASGGDAALCRADVSDSRQVKALFETADRLYGRLDVLVNNAGVVGPGLLTDVSDETWRRVMEVNAGGVFRCCREAVPYFLRTHTGSIVNVSSMWGICGASCETVYSASKAAVIGFTRALAKELGPSGIRVNAVAPGVIDTDMNAVYSEADKNALAEQTPLQRIGCPEETAEAIFFLGDRKSSFITGQVLGVDGGFVL